MSMVRNLSRVEHNFLIRMPKVYDRRNNFIPPTEIVNFRCSKSFAFYCFLLDNQINDL